MVTDIESYAEFPKRAKKYREDAEQRRKEALRDKLAYNMDRKGWQVVDMGEGEDGKLRWAAINPDKTTVTMIDPDEWAAKYHPDQPKYAGFWGEWKKDVHRDVVGKFGGMLVGVAADTIESATNIVLDAGDSFPLKFPSGSVLKASEFFRDVGQAPLAPIEGGEDYVEEQEWPPRDPAKALVKPLRMWQEVLREEAERWRLQPGKGGSVLDFARRSVINVAPFMALTVGAGAVGGASGAFLAGAFLEGGYAREDALRRGESPARAALEGIVVGIINGAIEMMQVGGILKFAKKYDDAAIATVKYAAREKMLHKLARRGGRLTLKALKLSGTEAVQEALQDTTTIGQALIGGEEISFWDAVERIFQSAAGAALASPVFGAAGIVHANRIARAQRNEPRVKYESIEAAMKDLKEMAATQKIYKLGSDAAERHRGEMQERLKAEELFYKPLKREGPAEFMRRKYPHLTSMARKILFVPQKVIDDLTPEADPGRYSGMFDSRTGNVYISKDLDAASQAELIGHELRHAYEHARKIVKWQETLALKPPGMNEKEWLHQLSAKEYQELPAEAPAYRAGDAALARFMQSTAKRALLEADLRNLASDLGVGKMPGRKQDLPKSVREAVDRRNLDFTEEGLKLPTGEPLRRGTAAPVLRRAKQRIAENKERLKRLNRLRKTASVESVRKALRVGDARVATRQEAIDSVKRQIADSEQYVADIEAGLELAEDEATKPRLRPETETVQETSERYQQHMASQSRPDLTFVGNTVSFAESWEKVPEHFRTPHGLEELARHVAPKWLVNRREGYEYVAKEVAVARELVDMFAGNLKRLTDIAMKYYNKKANAGDKFYKWLRNQPTNPIEKLFDDLDTRDWAPLEWSQEDQAAFNQLRKLLNDLREIANIGRRKAGLPEIKNRRHYIHHWYRDMMRHVQRNDYPIQAGYVWRIAKKFAASPHEWKNSSAFRRRVYNMIKDHYSKNVPELLHAIISYDVRDALLSAPYKAASEELQRLRHEGAPASVTDDLGNYLAYDIARQRHWLDEKLDRIFEGPTKAINWMVLRHIGRETDSLWMDAMKFVRRMGHLSALGFRVKPTIRNLGQRMLLTDLYSYTDTFTAQAHQADGWWPMVEAPNGEIVSLKDLLNHQAWWKQTDEYLSEGAETLRGQLGRAGAAMFHAAHKSNVGIAARVGYYDWLRRYQLGQDKNSSYYKEIRKFVVKHLTQEADVAYDKATKEQKAVGKEKFVGEYIAENLEGAMEVALVQKSDMMDMIRDAVRFTQWEYFPQSMPLHYRSETGKAALLFQSWIQNYYGAHLYEMGHRLFTGRDSAGRVLTKAERAYAFKGLGLIAGAGRAAELTLKAHILKYLILPTTGGTGPPLIEFWHGIYLALFGETEKQKRNGWRKAADFFRLMIPGRYAYKDVQKAREQQSLKPLMLYEKEKKRKEKR